MHLAEGLIPIGGESNILFALPVRCDFVVFFDDAYQMVCVFLSHIFYAKIVNDEAETDGAPLVRSQPGGEPALLIAMGVEARF